MPSLLFMLIISTFLPFFSFAKTVCEEVLAPPRAFHFHRTLAEKGLDPTKLEFSLVSLHIGGFQLIADYEGKVAGEIFVNIDSRYGFRSDITVFPEFKYRRVGISLYVLAAKILYAKTGKRLHSSRHPSD